MNMLERLVDSARADLERRKEDVPEADLWSRLEDRRPSRPFREALTRPGLSLIAEFKRSSPTAVDLAPNADVRDQVTKYERGGATAISVLTDHQNFGGSIEDLRTAVEACELPVLRKDFIIDRYQLVEAGVYGADAVLLMKSALRQEELEELIQLARELDLDFIVEVHDEEELMAALELDADVIGINNRDFPEGNGVVDVSATLRLMHDVPAGKTVVAESGYSRIDELHELERIGVDAVLIGTALMTASDAEAQAREFAGDADATREQPLP